MSPQAVAKLLKINQQFYTQFAMQWHETRLVPWRAFERIATYFKGCERFLDVGCGNGRLGAYLLHENELIGHYVGVDFSVDLLAAASGLRNSEFVQRDLSEPNALDGLGQFDGAAMLAVLHHIPTVERRVRLLNAVFDVLQPDSYFVISNFQFLASERTRRKVVDWAEVGLDSAELDPNDYLLNWQRGGYGYRYLNLIDNAAMQKLVAQTDFTLIESFRSDGKEGNLNLYTILQKQN